MTENQTPNSEDRDTTDSLDSGTSLSCCWGKEVSIQKNKIRQILVPDTDSPIIRMIRGKLWAISGRNRWRVLNPQEEYNSTELAIRLTKEAQQPTDVDLQNALWLGKREIRTPETVTRSLEDSFRFIEEHEETNLKGLRTPQIGAAHAVMGYWTLKQVQPATVVMPTGTGKTETMLSLFAASQPKLLLVLVPSDALREQISNKFQNYGVLQRFGVINDKALCPAVGKIIHGFTDASSAIQFARSCNVIITTPNALNCSSSDARIALLKECSHLFVDEAHHITAPTWRSVRDEFAGKPVVQFTATPYREDGADLGGKLIYIFPLHAAQEQGYFSKINYSAVVDFDDTDRAIAIKAISQLRADISNGFDHILMARVKRIGRAKDLLPIYEELASDLKPVILHSELKPKQYQQESLSAVRTGKSKIIICVNMLGEGFDLPSLKIAAVHDRHKSLGITLQFIGRFARSSKGEASIIVGRTDPDYDENLKQLYAEDADWNQVINDLSASAIGEQEAIGEFEEGFSTLPDEVSLRNISPKMSTVVYKTYCTNWRTEKLTEFFEGKLYTDPIAVNEKDHMAWLVVKEAMPIRWGDLKTIEEVTYDLYAFHWDPDTKLLYINSSNNDSVHEEVAKALCGETVERYKGKDVYKTMANIKRRIPTNIGFLDVRNRNRRFAMVSGFNVTEAFPVAEAQTKTQTNIFAYGFENGERTSIGASLKGRIWSYRAAPTLKHWMDWCKHIGAKLTDITIDTREVIAGFIQPEDVSTRPKLVPLALEWPWELFQSLSEDLRLEHNGSAYPLIDSELIITKFEDEGPIPFQVVTPNWTADYSLTIGDGRLAFSPLTEDVNILTSRISIPFSTYLNKHGLRIILEREAIIEPQAILIKPNRDLPPYNPENLTVLDWTGTDIKKESQGKDRDPQSIQARMIKYISDIKDWDIIIDDDGSGEMADIVAASVEGSKLSIMLTHCKYSKGVIPGGRVDDLYEVCGQAQKSAEWKRKPELMFRHLIRREMNRRRNGIYGLVKGTQEKLVEIAEKAPFLQSEFKIAIAQPGLSKKQLSRPQSDLLACTEVYVMEIANSSFDVFTSE